MDEHHVLQDFPWHRVSTPMKEPEESLPSPKRTIVTSRKYDSGFIIKAEKRKTQSYIQFRGLAGNSIISQVRSGQAVYVRISR